MKIVYLLMLLTLCCSTVYAKDYGDVTASVLSVYDGDTFTVNINNYPKIIGEKISIRMCSINAYEINSKIVSENIKAKQAKVLLTNKLKGKIVILKQMQRDKYFRIIANTYVDTENISDYMIKTGLAFPYFGGTK
jgi:micrococcal nuclease